MSLITQMLNDLEKRQAANPETNPLAGRINLTTPAQKSLPGGLTLVAILVGSGVFGAFVWSQFQARGDGKTIQPVGVVATAPAPVEASPAAASEPAPVATPTVAKPAAAPMAAKVSKVEQVSSTTPAVTAKAIPNDTPKDTPKEVPAETPKETPKETLKEAPKEAPKSISPPVSTAQATVPAVAVKSATSVTPGAMKSVTVEQKSGNLYKQAVGMLQQFRSQEAIDLLREALRNNSGNHDARILLAAVLADGARLAEAIETLEQGLKLSPEFTPYYRVLARTQATAGNRAGALATLQKGSATAGNDAEFHALYAALLQQQGSHDEAVKHYLVSLRSDPMHGPWLVGIAISLQATQRNSDAVEAYKRAIDSGDLAPDVAKFASEQLTLLR